MKQHSPHEDIHMTQQEVADAFGISRPQIGSIEARAMKKFKKLLEERGYKMEDLLGGMA